MSSSLAIRKHIAAASKRSLEMMDEYNKSFKNLKLDDIEPEELSFHLEKAKLLRQQLNATRKHITENIEKWDRLIAQKTNIKDREIEEEIYNQFIEQAEHNYFEAGEKSTDAINGLDKLIVELSYMMRPDNTEGTFHEPEAPRVMEASNFRLAAKLNHPTFDGNLETWPTFSETFKSAIHNNPSYTTIEKLSYLMSYLKGEAAESVVGYPIIASSYEIVWSVLEDRFGDKDRLVHKMQTELRNLPPCRNSSQQELRRVYSTITRTTRCLTSFEVDCDNDQTIAIIEEKVPKNILRELYIAKETNGIKTWSVERLIKELNKIIKLNEKIDSVRPDSHVAVNMSPTQKHNAVMIMHGKPKTPCILCGGPHWNSDCNSYPDTESKATRLRELQRCFICLQKGHTARSCDRQVTCKICNRKHSTLICRSADNGSQTQSASYRQATQNHGFSTGHPKQFNKTPQIKPTQQTMHPKPQNQAPLTGGNAVAIRQTNFATQRTPTKKNGHLLSGIVTLLKPDGTTKDVAALIDTCSTVTLISDSLLKECGVEIQAQPDDKTKQAPLFAITTLGDQTSYYDDKWGTVEVSTIDQTSLTLTAQIIPNLMKTVDIIIANDKGGTKTIETKAELLIGADHLYEIITEKPIKLDDNGNSVYKWETLIGTAYGGGRTEKTITAILKKEDIKQEEEPQNPINWSIEDSVTNEESDDEIARQLFNKHLTRDPETGRYTTKWLFKEDPSALPSNIETAFARLKSTIAGLKRSAMPNAIQAYDAQIKAELANGTTELVTDDTPQGEIIHFLCHHAVYKLDSRTHELRIVYDGSAPTWDGRCLNDLMHRGPINLPSIPGCLIRLRSAPIGMVGDVQKAFHQVGLAIPDRDFTRFLWVKDINKPLTKDNINVYRFTSVTFGIVSSPSLLGMTIDIHLKNHEHPLAEKLRRDLYVDNVTFHVNDVEDGKDQYRSSKKIFADARMNLREFMSSNKELNQYLMEMEGHEIPKTTKFLGVPWNLESDEYVFPLPPTPKEEKPVTMRKVLEHISKAYDICGLNAPALLKPKLFFQNLMYKSGGKVKWDDNLQQEDAQQ